MTSNKQQGFLLVPLMLLTLLITLLIGLAARDLSSGYLTHRLQLYQSCQTHLERIHSSQQASCPPCPQPRLCQP